MTSDTTPTISDTSIVTLRDAINSHDLDRIVASFTEDFRSNLPMHPSRSFVGNEQVRQNWTILLSRLPNIRAEIKRAISSENVCGQRADELPSAGPVQAVGASLGGHLVRDGERDVAAGVDFGQPSRERCPYVVECVRAEWLT
jgi:hypothetical protein